MKPRDDIADLLRQESLPPAMLAVVEQLHVPLAQRLAQWARAQSSPLLVGLCGAQGSGKSTAARLLPHLLAAQGLSALALSIDDFYLTRAARDVLSRTVHPLFRTRGVPGTHDVALAMTTLQSLRSGRPTSLPRFDKASDERLPVQSWPKVAEAHDIILLEGWCVGAVPQAPAELHTPVNALERDFDAAGLWRTHVNAVLAQDYQPFFAMLDRLMLLAAPSFDVVFGWRLEQEQTLRRQVRAAGGDSSRIMDDSQIRHFIAHYERLTRHILREMPQRADLVVQLDAQRRPP